MGEGYVKKRRGLIGHLQFFAQSPFSLVVWEHMILLANWKSGVVETTAGQIGASLQSSTHKVRRALTWLLNGDRKSGRPPYIVRVQAGNRFSGSRWRVVNYDGLHPWNWEEEAIICHAGKEGRLCKWCVTYPKGVHQVAHYVAHYVAQKVEHRVRNLDAELVIPQGDTPTKKIEDRTEKIELSSEMEGSRREREKELAQIFELTEMFTLGPKELRLVTWTLQIFGTVQAASVELLRWAEWYKGRGEKVRDPARAWIRWMQTWSTRNGSKTPATSLSDIIGRAAEEFSRRKDQL